MRVLVAEDEVKMAALLKQGLEEHNHSVTVDYDGRETLELAGSHEFDVIVLDVMLPGLDGFEVARRLRKNQKQVPILMLTARDAIPDIARGLPGIVPKTSQYVDNLVTIHQRPVLYP